VTAHTNETQNNFSLLHMKQIKNKCRPYTSVHCRVRVRNT